ncbi:MAG: hypothetical protein FWD58_08470, partial [Firmicutes bacterium]|nr:hypothetical protein [Bacillota bacterium]
MKLLKIAFSNMRKRKGGAITFFAIVAMAALMLSISLSLLLNVGSFYDKKRAELNTSDFSVGIAQPFWQGAMEESPEGYVSMPDYAKSYPGAVGEPQVFDFLSADIKYELGSGSVKQQLLFYNQSVPKTMNTYKVIDRRDEQFTQDGALKDGGILLALNFKYGGIAAGGRFSFTCLKEVYTYTVAGFFEDAEMGASTSTVKAAYVSDAEYGRLEAREEAFIPFKFLSVNFEKIATSYEFETQFSQKYGLSMRNSFSVTYDQTKFMATMFALIMSFVLIGVAALVLVIALVIVRFTIKNNIEEDIKTLGALKSIGYTSGQITAAIVIEFLLIAVLAGIAGVLLGLATAGYVGNVVSMTSGLLFGGAAFGVPAVLSVAAVTAVTLAVTYFVAKSSKKVTPINALRSGLGSHNFKKNYAPLEKTKMPLNLAVALKSFLGGIKNNVTAFIVLFLFGFTCVLGFALYQNFVVDTAAFKQMIGVEPAEVQVGANVPEDADEATWAEIDAMMIEISRLPGVERFSRMDVYPATSGGTLISLCAWENIDEKNPGTLIAGRFPKFGDEIALLSTVASVLGKGVGDRVTIEYDEGKHSASFLVSGITQSVGGGVCDLTKGGIAALSALSEDKIVLCGMNLFLENTDTDAVDEFVDNLLIAYGASLNAVNLAEAVNGTLVALKEPIALATYLIVGVTVFTVCFVFFLLMNTLLRRRKKDFGIQKALGFTTGQIILQTLLSLLPVILAGTGLGILAGVLLTNPLLGIMFAGLGIAKPLFVISPLLT